MGSIFNSLFDGYFELLTATGHLVVVTVWGLVAKDFLRHCVGNFVDSLILELKERASILNSNLFGRRLFDLSLVSGLLLLARRAHDRVDVLVELAPLSQTVLRT